MACEKYYALINRDRGLYEEILVLTFKAHGPKSRLNFTELERCLLC